MLMGIYFNVWFLVQLLIRVNLTNVGVGRKVGIIIIFFPRNNLNFEYGTYNKIMHLTGESYYSAFHQTSNSSPLSKSLQLLKLPDIVIHNTLLFMFKLKSGLLPTAFCDYFPLNSEIHDVNTREKDNSYLPLFHSSFIQRSSIKYQGAVQWNSSNEFLNLLETYYIEVSIYFIMIWLIRIHLSALSQIISIPLMKFVQ